MEKANESPGKGLGTDAQLPPPGRHVMVRCRGFRCLAYRDPQGKWKSVYGDKVLPEVLEVLSAG